jgi:hypothetical protein
VQLSNLSEGDLKVAKGAKNAKAARFTVCSLLVVLMPLWRGRGST